MEFSLTMICAACPNEMQFDLRICPNCASYPEIDVLLKSAFGRDYFPEAFKPPYNLVGISIAEKPTFRSLFIQYVQHVVLDAAQLIAFRGNLIQTHSVLAYSSFPASTSRTFWAALSSATDRYFAEKTRHYQWTVEQIIPLVSRWYQLISAAFLGRHNDLDLQVVRDWSKDFISLHKSSTGPFAACELCAAKCSFRYDVSQLLNLEEKYATNQLHFNTTSRNTELMANSILKKASEWTGARSEHFGTCLAVHLLAASAQPDDFNECEQLIEILHRERPESSSNGAEESEAGWTNIQAVSNEADEFSKDYIFLAIQFKEDNGIDLVVDDQGFINLFLYANGESRQLRSVEFSYKGIEEARLLADNLADEYVQLLSTKFGIEFSALYHDTTRQLEHDSETEEKVAPSSLRIVRSHRLDELAALNRAMECSAPAAYQRPEELPLTIALINDSLIETNETAVALKYTEDGRPTLFISPYLVQQGRPTDLDSIDEDETESWQASFMRQLAWKSAIDCGKFPLTEEESKQLGWVPIKFNQGARLFALRSKNGCLFRPYEEPITTDKVWARCSEEGNYLNSFGEPAINTAEIEFLTVEQMSHLAEVNPCSERFLNAEEEIVEALCMFRRGSQLRARLKRESPSLYDIVKNLDQLSIDRCYEPIANHCQFLRATDGLLVENNDANQQAIMNFEETQLVNK